MKDGFVKVAVGTPEVRVADCVFNREQSLELILQAAEQGVSREMMVIIRNNDVDEPYSSVYGHMDIELIANKTKLVPSSYINSRGNNVTDECLEYILPLIEGECYPEYKHGLPVFFSFE